MASGDRDDAGQRARELERDRGLAANAARYEASRLAREQAAYERQRQDRTAVPRDPPRT